MENWAEKAAQNLARMREKKPLVHNITNPVAMNFTANALLAAGASPVMAVDPEEVREIVSAADALALNIGVLSRERILAMLAAGKTANALKIPVVLDPVGAGAADFRTRAARKLVETIELTVIRGNPTEILSLVSTDLRTPKAGSRGVDAAHRVDEVAETAPMLARELKVALTVTGPEDLLCDGRRVVLVRNGHPMMARVTASGCTLTAIIAAFLTVDPDPLIAAASAVSYFGLAGQTAAKTAAGPGSFMTGLIDALYCITPETLNENAKITPARFTPETRA